MEIGSSVDNGNETYQGLAMSLQFLDSPSTTSQVTYELYHKMDTGTGYFNRNQNVASADDVGQTCVILSYGDRRVTNIINAILGINSNAKVDVEDNDI